MLFFELFSVTSEEVKRDRRFIRLGMLLLLLYLAINSIMFQSIMISSLAGGNLLISAIESIRNVKNQKSKIWLIRE